MTEESQVLFFELGGVKHRLRYFRDLNGETWFATIDLARLVGASNSSNFTRNKGRTVRQLRIPNPDKGYQDLMAVDATEARNILTSGQKQNLAAIPYLDQILRSQLDSDIFVPGGLLGPETLFHTERNGGTDAPTQPPPTVDAHRPAPPAIPAAQSSATPDLARLALEAAHDTLKLAGKVLETNASKLDLDRLTDRLELLDGRLRVVEANADPKPVVTPDRRKIDTEPQNDPVQDHRKAFTDIIRNWATETDFGYKSAYRLMYALVKFVDGLDLYAISAHYKIPVLDALERSPYAEVGMWRLDHLARLYLIERQPWPDGFAQTLPFRLPENPR